MKQTQLLLVVVVLVAVCVALFVGRWQDADQVVIDRPAWLQPVAKVDSRAVPATADVVRTQVPTNSASVEAPVLDETSATRAMVPPELLAEALLARKQKITFLAEMDLDPQAANELAEGLSAAAEKMVRMLSHANGTEDALSMCSAEYFCAMWPELPRLVAEKRLVTKVVPARSGHRVPAGLAVSTYNYSDDTLLYSVTTERWQLQLHFIAEGNPFPELFKRFKDTDEDKDDK